MTGSSVAPGGGSARQSSAPDAFSLELAEISGLN